MGRLILIGTLIATSLLVLSADQGQPGALSSQTQKLDSEVLITTLSTADLTKQVTAESGAIDHKSEVARGGPVAAVVRTKGCGKDANGACRVNADVVIYKPDGSVFHEAKNLDLPAGRAAIPLKIDAQAPTGVYKVVVTIRDLEARRFGSVERLFGVK
jgi:hypothetical protein